VFDRGHVSGQAAKSLYRLCALVRETGDHAPEVVHFLSKLPVFAEQPRDHRVELVLLLCGLSQPVEHALHVLKPADELRGKV